MAVPRKLGIGTERLPEHEILLDVRWYLDVETFVWERCICKLLMIIRRCKSAESLHLSLVFPFILANLEEI